MKGYIRTIKEVICVNKKDLVFYGSVPLIGAVIGIIMVLVILAVDGTGADYGELGAFLTILIGGIALIFGGFYGTQCDFNMAISMGKTRKHFVIAEYILLLIETVMVAGIALLVGKLEGLLYTAIYPQAVCEIGISAWLANPATFMGIALGVPALVMLKGVLLMISPKYFFWVIWAIWMFGCMVLPNIIKSAMHEPDSVMGRIIIGISDTIKGVPTGGLVAIILLIIIAVMSVNTVLYRRQRVTA